MTPEPEKYSTVPEEPVKVPDREIGVAVPVNVRVFEPFKLKI